MSKGQGKTLGKWVMGKIGSFLSPFLLFVCFPLLLYAQGTVTVAQPRTDRISDTFRIRTTHPATGAANKPHWGTDFATPCGTPLPTPAGGNLICPTGGKPSGGAGIIGDVDLGCGVTERYFHLQSCTSSGMISGSTGVGTGCHVHHEVHIDGVKVNPQRAYTAGNLCDPNIKKQLMEDSKNDMNGMTGKGGGGAAGGKRPPTQGGTTYVPPGGINPYTGLPNTGGGYYIIEYEDGRTEMVPELPGGGDTVILPEGTPADFVPRTTTGNEITGCAVDTWTAMVNQSILQTRREMIANQLLIRKGDSVMAYACLTEHMDFVGKKAGPIFSETKRWVNRDVDLMGKTVTVNKELGETSLDGSIYNVALSVYEEFIASYFSHDFLGGALESGSDAGHGGEDHAHAEDQSYTPCGAMSVIWQYAKCKDADENPMFHTFEQLISSDPRTLPDGYQCNFTGIKQEHIDVAKGSKTKFDPVDTHFDLLFPDEAGKCPDPIITGITVTRMKPTDGIVSEEESYADGLCVAAGCSFEKTDEGGKCVLQ